MRPFFLLTLLFSSVLSSAQRPARVVFFRIDDESIPSRGAYDSWMQRTAALMKDEVQIADMSKLSLLVYTDAGTGGAYYFAPLANGDSLSNALATRPLDGGIAFVKISMDRARPTKTVLEPVSLAEFQNYFTEQPWMRKSFQKLGYTSLGHLADGFEVLPPVRVRPHKPLFSLTDSVFYNSKGKRTKKREAAWYRVARRDSAGLFGITDYYFPEHRLKTRSRFSTLDSESREGSYESYFRSGALESRGMYAENRMEGRWEFFRDSSAGGPWYTVEYRHGKQDGMLKSYYPDGRLKREEIRKIFRDTVREYDADPQPRIIERDSLMGGKRYDTEGREILFTPMHIMPKADFGLNSFLAKVLRYPREARIRGIEGRVVLQFTVSVHGEVLDTEVIRHADPLLDAEALRVVKMMPYWAPGELDDERVPVSFTLPVTFRLD